MAITPHPESSKTSPNLLSDDLMQQPAWYINVNSGRIVITEDKVELYLREYAESVTARAEVYVWLGILLTIALTFVTASFHNFLGIPGAVWTAVFLLGAILALALCVVAFRHSRNAPTIQDVIRRMAQGSTAQSDGISSKPSTKTDSTISATSNAGVILQPNPQRWYSMVKVLGTILNAMDSTPPDDTSVIIMSEENIWRCCLTALADLDGRLIKGHELQAKLVYRELIAVCNAIPDAKILTEPKASYHLTAVQAAVNKMIERAH